MRRTIPLLCLGAALAFLLLFAGAVRLQAASTTFDCEIGEEAVCEVNDSDYLQSVRVTLQTAQGPLIVVDNNYSCTADVLMSGVTVRWDPIVPDFQIEVLDCDDQSESAYGFGNLLHHSLGDAQLRRDGPNLTVLGFDGAGDDGVAIDTGAASQWEALLLPGESPAAGGFDAAIFGDDLTTPVAEIQFSKHMTDVIVYPSPSFDDDPYHVQLFAGDDLLYEQQDVPGGTGAVGFPQWFCTGAAQAADCAPRLTVGLDAATNSWFWQLTLPAPTGFETPGGRLQGDRLRFNAQGDPGAGQPTTFQQVHLTGRNLPYLIIYGEAVRGPLPAHDLALPAVFNGDGDDLYGLQALTDFLEAPTPPANARQINDSLYVEVIGPGNLVEEEVVEETPGGEPRGEPAPDEPPLDDVPVQRQALRVFNTANKMEYEIVVEGPLLEQIHGLRRRLSATGAMPGIDSLGADGMVGWLGPIRMPDDNAWFTPRDPDGWSGGVDNRTLLTSTTWWPWRALVHFSNNCSGVLIGPRHILTAAHCINQRGTNNWFSFTVTPGRNGAEKPYGDSQMNPNPQPGDPFRWYFTPTQWRSAQYGNSCPGNCYAATEWDWGLIIIPEHLGYQTGWMGYVARPAGQLNVQSHFNRAYPWCNTPNNNEPDNCQPASLYGDTQLCTMGDYLFQGGDNWNRVIRTSCDISGGHSGSPVYHYFYDWQLGQTVPVAAMVAVWEHCYTCSSGDLTPTSARRLTPNDLSVISFFRQWKP